SEEFDPNEWREALTPDGRKYYYNALTRKSVWTLPVIFISHSMLFISIYYDYYDYYLDYSIIFIMVSNLLKTGEWKEATSSDGRIYYYNTVTKKTTWEKPISF